MHLSYIQRAIERLFNIQSVGVAYKSVLPLGSTAAKFYHLLADRKLPR